MECIIHKTLQMSPAMAAWAVLLSVGLLAASASLGWAEDKAPPSRMTLDNCAKVDVVPQKVERSNGTVWLQSVTCEGDSLAPEVRKPSIASISLGETLTGSVDGSR